MLTAWLGLAEATGCVVLSFLQYLIHQVAMLYLWKTISICVRQYVFILPICMFVDMLYLCCPFVFMLPCLNFVLSYMCVTNLYLCGNVVFV